MSNPQLAQELRELLANHDDAESKFLVTDAGDTGPIRERDVSFSFQPGDILAGRFAIVRPVGRGGMGEVYEAEDRESGLRVAVKCLSRAIQNDNTVRLFRREIDVARQITDPNVCRVHDVFVHPMGDGEVLLLSMEIIDGETLQQRLEKRGAMPVKEAEPILRQLLSGLMAAHRAGIIHRDLKPSNVLISNEGTGGPERIVITDFGLARKRTTVSSNTTIAGGIAGTFEYMAPEQVLGQTVIASDIYAVGLIMFEMLTGRKPFEGSPMQQAAQRLAGSAPRARKFSRDVPRFWDYVIGRCLERDAGNRFQSAGALIAALDGNFEAFGIGRLRWWFQRRWKPVLSIAAASFVAIAIAAAAYRRNQDPTPKTVSLIPVTTGSGLTMHAAISRDGARLAYVSDRETRSNLQLWIQSMADEATRRRITEDQFDTSAPSFSTDGKRLVFRWEREGGGLYVADVAGGRPRLLVPDGVAGRFSPDDQWIAYWIGEQAEIPTVRGTMYLIPSAGGAPRRLAGDFASARNPVFLNDGEHLLFEGLRDPHQLYDDAADWYVLNLKSGEAVPTGAMKGLRRSSLHAYNQPGNFYGDRLVFSARYETSANVYQYQFDLNTFAAIGDPEQLTFTTVLMDTPSISNDGTLVVTSISGALNVWQLAGNGETSDQKLTDSLQYDSHPTVSDDGNLLAFARTLGRERQIWFKGPSGEKALVTTKQEKYRPVIRRDGAEVAFGAIDQNGHSIYQVSTRDTATKKICTSCGDPTDWSHDNRLLLSTQGIPSSISTVDTVTGAIHTVAKRETDLGEARFGPRDHWIVLREGLRNAHSRIVLTSVEAGPASPWIPVTSGTAADDKPVWSRDGKSIYYLSNRDGFSCIYMQRLLPDYSGPLDRPIAVRHFHSHTFTPAEASLIAFNFALAPGHIIANPASLQGNVWKGRLSTKK